ncbi:MAG TPA: hypothetical protein VN819_04345 [Thermoplasmata archaeon]|nr:hypothetical protein [Thermoplasmata archaeon]
MVSREGLVKLSFRWIKFTTPVAAVPPPPQTALHRLKPEDARWLEEFLEGRARHEDLQLGARATYFVALMTALVAAEVAAQVYDQGVDLPHGFGHLTVTWIPALAAAVSIVWAIVMARTVAAQHLWREALRELEKHAPLFSGAPIGSLPWDPSSELSPVSDLLRPDLSQPTTMHHVVFSERPLKTLRYAFSPNEVWEWMPWFGAAVWIIVGGLAALSEGEPQAILTLTIFPAVVIEIAYGKLRQSRQDA